MKNKVHLEFKNDSVDLVNFIIKYFRVFVITGFAAAFITAGITLLIKPLFESTVVMYPSSNLGEIQTMLGTESGENTFFGDDDGTEKLLQILRSEQLREYLKAKYDLASHYDIKSGYKYPNTLIAQKMNKYISSSKTSYGSVEIKVRDRDRQTACAMANDMAARADTIFNNIQHGTAARMLSEINETYMTQLSLVKQYEDSLSILPGLGKTSNNSVTDALYKEYYKEIVSGNSTVVDDLKRKMKGGNYDMAKYLRLLNTLETETKYLSLIRSRYIEAQALSRQTLPYALIIDRATVAEKKAYPRRSIIVVVSVFSVLLLLALILFVAEGITLHRTDDRQ